MSTARVIHMTTVKTSRVPSDQSLTGLKRSGTARYLLTARQQDNSISVQQTFVGAALHSVVSGATIDLSCIFQLISSFKWEVT